MNWELRLPFPVVTSGRESHVSMKKRPLRHLPASVGVLTAALAPIPHPLPAAPLAVKKRESNKSVTFTKLHQTVCSYTLWSLMR